MRSKLSSCLAAGSLAAACLAAAMMVCGAPSNAHAADPKKGGAKKKAGENLNDNFDKQMQWENNVMGPDDKRAELAKIARASAIAKAAADKAATEKAVADKNAAKEEAKRTPATKSAAPVLIATPEDENAGKSTKSKDRDDKGGHEISPKLSTEEAMTPPQPVKPTDDKFIDKLLKGEPGKKKVVRNDDELNDLLARTRSRRRPSRAGSVSTASTICCAPPRSSPTCRRPRPRRPTGPRSKPRQPPLRLR